MGLTSFVLCTKMKVYLYYYSNWVEHLSINIYEGSLKVNCVMNKAYVLCAFLGPLIIWATSKNGLVNLTDCDKQVL